LSQSNLDDSEYNNDSLLWYLEDILGESVVQAELTILRQANSTLDTYLNFVKNHRSSRQKIPKQPYSYPNYANLRSKLEEATIGSLGLWGKQADEFDLRLAALDL